MSWNLPLHRMTERDARDARIDEADARTALQNSRTARTVAQHATDAQDCRLLLDMLGLRLDDLRTDPR